MLTPTGPKCLEFNVRFGDPETETLLPLLAPETDLAEIFLVRRLSPTSSHLSHSYRTSVEELRVELTFLSTGLRRTTTRLNHSRNEEGLLRHSHPRIEGIPRRLRQGNSNRNRSVTDERQCLPRWNCAQGWEGRHCWRESARCYCGRIDVGGCCQAGI